MLNLDLWKWALGSFNEDWRKTEQRSEAVTDGMGLWMGTPNGLGSCESQAVVETPLGQKVPQLVQFLALSFLGLGCSRSQRLRTEKEREKDEACLPPSPPELPFKTNSRLFCLYHSLCLRGNYLTSQSYSYLIYKVGVTVFQ